MGGSNFQLYDLSVGNVYSSITTTVVPAIPADKWPLVTFGVSGLTVETVTLQGSFDNSVWFSLRCIDCSTGALAAAVTLGNGCFKADRLGFPWIKIIKSAGAETATITLSGRAN